MSLSRLAIAFALQLIRDVRVVPARNIMRVSEQYSSFRSERIPEEEFLVASARPGAELNLLFQNKSALGSSTV